MEQKKITFNRDLNKAMKFASQKALVENSDFITPEHLLYGMMTLPQMQDLMWSCNEAFDIDDFLDELDEHIEESTKDDSQGAKPNDICEPSFQLQQVFTDAVRQAIMAERKAIDMPMAINAILCLENSWAAYLLRKHANVEDFEIMTGTEIHFHEHSTGVEEDDDQYSNGEGDNPFGLFDDDDEDLLFGDEDDYSSPSHKNDKWKKYVTCINEHLKDKNPLIGREKELDRTIQVLCRKDKNNPLHIGEPGVGKTALVYGVARRIEEGKVPDRLKGCNIYQLDMGTLLAGTRFRGDMEQRLKQIMEGVTSEAHCIIYLDEIHNIVGAGKGAEGGSDVSDLLKPYLDDDRIRVIGATTYTEYNKNFTRSVGMIRRFQTIDVEEPSIDEAIHILKSLKPIYEKYHHVKYDAAAIEYAVTSSAKFITDRFLPDKAIDLMDEAAAKLRMERDSQPEELDEITRRLRQLEIEREAIKREGDEAKLDALNKEIAELQEREKNFRAKWEGEKEVLAKIQQDKQQMEQLKFEAERAEREGDYGRVAEIRYGKLQQLQHDIDAQQEQLRSRQGAEAMVKEEVTPDDIADVVARWTGIPVTRMLQSEREKLLHLEDELHRRVVGQDEAIQAVADAVRRSRAGLQDPKRPIGSFIFLGTTGVGKTELAKALADYLFNDENMMTRIDMSEYQEKFSVSRLVGAPPGYVGYEEGGQLTEAVRRKPYSVVLFDEIEKAHPDVFNILLQVLDDGRLTDNKGRTVNFKNTIIIMTSNMGSQLIQQKFEAIARKSADERERIIDETKGEVLEMLKKTIRPEFLNRIDDIIMFEPLTQPQIEQIVRLQVNGIERLLKDQDVHIEVSDAAVKLVAKAGFDPEFGARPVKRALQRLLLNDLSKALLAGTVDKTRPIRVDVDGDALRFSNAD